MALNAYLAQVESLLDDFSNVEYTSANLTVYINDARLQIAGSSESIKLQAALALTNTVQSYAFSAATGFSGIGVGGILSVRMAALSTGPGYTELDIRPWEWFWRYYVCQNQATRGLPTKCAEFEPGINGTIWFWPVPNATLSVLLDAIGYPIPLVTDSTIEALSYPWTEAVQYYAAYLALLNAQRKADADAMYARYKEFEWRATQMTTPTVLPGNTIGTVGAKVAATHTPLTMLPTQGQQ
jgi:hypothetical protein